MQALTSRKQFGRIGLVGHSEGSQIAAAVAARHPEAVDFIVSLGGLGVSGLDLVMLQDRHAAVDLGATPSELARIMSYVQKYYETVLATPDGEPRIAALKAIDAGRAIEDLELITKYNMNEATLMPEVAAQPFLPVSLKTDARTDWFKVRCPVLVLNGSLDYQVPAKENVTGIVGALNAGGNLHVESAVLPSLNHGFQTASTGSVEEYKIIEETMAPSALLMVANFVRARVDCAENARKP